MNNAGELETLEKVVNFIESLEIANDQKRILKSYVDDLVSDALYEGFNDGFARGQHEADLD